MSERRAVVGAVLLGFAVSPLFAWNVFTPSLRREFDVDEATLATVFSVGLAAFALSVLVGGRFADVIAPRRLALITAAVTVVGLLGSAAASSVAALVVTYGLVLGSGTGLGYATAVRVAGTVKSRRGLALSVVVSAYAAGTVVVAPVAVWLLGTVGRGWTFVALAGLLGGCLVAAAVLVSGQPPRPSPRQRHATRRCRSTGPLVGALWVAFGFGSAPALAAFAHAGELAGPSAGAALAVPLLSFGNFAGRLLAGPLSDRVGRSAALHANCAVLVVACLPLAVDAAGPLSLLSLLLLGIQYGALSVLAPAATSDAVPSQCFGATYGVVFTGWGVAGLVAPVAAALLAAAAGFDGVYLVAVGAAAISWTSVAVYGWLLRRGVGAG